MASEKSPSYCFILNSKPACVFSPCNPTDCSTPRCSVHGIFPGKNTGVGCHFLHQGIFLTQGSWQVDSLPLVPPGEPPLYQILPITQPFSIYIKYYPYISFLSVYLFWRLQEIFFFPLYHCYLFFLFNTFSVFIEISQTKTAQIFKTQILFNLFYKPKLKGTVFKIRWKYWTYYIWSRKLQEINITEFKRWQKVS